MGLINKVTKKEDNTDLTKEQAQFVITKLRSANYKGDEFEQYFIVMKKLSDYLKTIN